MLFRIGGEEFIVRLQAESKIVVEKIRKQVD